MAVLAATGWPDRQISATNCNFAIIPRNQFISGRGPMAVLSTRGRSNRMARHPDFSDKLHFRYYPARSVYQAQWPFYQREAQWPFYQSRNNRMARPPDFSDQLHFRYYPAQSVYQRPGQAILSKSRPNCRFIKAEATMARLPDFSDKLHFRYYPARSIYQRSGQAILSKSRLTSRFMHARANGLFMKAETTGRPDLQTSATNCILHDQFISGRAKLFSPKTGPMAVLSTRAQWPFYQEQRPDSQTPDLSRGLQVPYNPAQSVYQRPGQAIFSKSKPNGRFIKAGADVSCVDLLDLGCR